MADLDANDPRPVLRKELDRVFKNQRVVRAFEKIFDLIPPQFIDQQAQIDALNAIAELGSAQSNEAISALTRLASAVEQLSMAPAPLPVSDLVNLSSYPMLDVTINVTWTDMHTFAGIRVPGVATSSVVLGCQIADNPHQVMINASAAANSKVWQEIVSGVTKIYRTVDDGFTAASNYFSIVRAANVIVSVSFGNATDNPDYTFLGTKTPKHGGTQLIQGSAGFTNNAAAAVGTLNNAPVAGNPTKWIPINDNGTIRNIPAW